MNALFLGYVNTVVLILLEDITALVEWDMTLWLDTTAPVYKPILLLLLLLIILILYMQISMSARHLHVITPALTMWVVLCAPVMMGMYWMMISCPVMVR